MAHGKRRYTVLRRQEQSADVIETSPCKSMRDQRHLRLAQPETNRASFSTHIHETESGSYRRTIPFSGLLAVFLAPTAICIAERQLLLCVSIAELRRHLEI